MQPIRELATRASTVSQPVVWRLYPDRLEREHRGRRLALVLEEIDELRVWRAGMYRGLGGQLEAQVIAGARSARLTSHDAVGAGRWVHRDGELAALVQALIARRSVPPALRCVLGSPRQPLWVVLTLTVLVPLAVAVGWWIKLPLVPPAIWERIGVAPSTWRLLAVVAVALLALAALRLRRGSVREVLAPEAMARHPLLAPLPPTPSGAP
jgi:hypothetical protein